MNQNQHKQFVDDLVKLADEQGKANAEARLGEMKKLAKASKADLLKFVEMIRVGKQVVLRHAIRDAGRSMREARKLGQEFGKVKLADL